MNTDQDIAFLSILKYRCEQSQLDFARYQFKNKNNFKMLIAPHHVEIAKVLRRVIDGEITRLIINIPPRYTKTELAVINFMAYSLSIEPRSRFVHLSYSQKLALNNSAAVKDIISSPQNMALWPCQIKNDANAKERWYNSQNGGIYAASTGGQVTGFGAGLMKKGFYGALIIDDPVKPDDTRSQLKRLTINERYNNTIASRIATQDTPIIVIMQRIHDNDLSGYLLRGGSGEKWHHLELPVLVDNKRSYPRDWTHGIQVKHELPDGPLWPEKHNIDQINVLKASKFTYAAQYDQRPLLVEGSVFDGEKFQYFDPENMPVFEYVGIYADTAQKTNQWNDYSVFQAWGYKSGSMYLIDQVRDKFTAPDLKTNLRHFVEKFNNPNATYSKLRHVKIEDKSSGTGLIQDLSRGNKHTGELPLPVPVLPLSPNSRDKLSRAMDAAPMIESERIFIPKRGVWVNDYVTEFAKFSADDSHDFDDQVDCTMYAIQDMLQNMTLKVGVF